MNIEQAVEGALDRALEKEQNHETKERIRDALTGLSCKEAVNILLMMVTEYKWRSQFDKGQESKWTRNTQQ